MWDWLWLWLVYSDGHERKNNNNNNFEKDFWEDFVDNNENTDELYTIRDKSEDDVKDDNTDDTNDISISFPFSNSRLFLFPTKYYRSIIIIYKN